MTTRAVCIGTNYKGSQYELYGCENDAIDWAEKWGARGAEVTRLLGTDASRRNIFDAIEAVVSRSRVGDRVVVTNSTHGTFVPDVDGDEPDRQDEAFCPDDFQSAGVILDDHLQLLLNQRSWGVRSLHIADSCYSGTLSRLAGFEQRDAVGSYRKARFIPPSQIEHLLVGIPRALRSTLPPSRTVLHAACRDDQVAWDAWFPLRGKYNGAFTRAAIDALPEGRTTFAAWHASTLALLNRDEYPQDPQLFVQSRYQRYTLV